MDAARADDITRNPVLLKLSARLIASACERNRRVGRLGIEPDGYGGVFLVARVSSGFKAGRGEKNMRLRRGPAWGVGESEVTPESVWLDRRRLIRGVAAGVIGTGAATLTTPSHAFLGFGESGAQKSADGAAEKKSTPDPSAGRYPAARNTNYTLDRPLTDEEQALSYNNFYEFGSHKQIARAAQGMSLRPWTVAITGLVEQPLTLDIDTLLGRVTLEERLYRHRCVEAWAMAVPWSGFPMKDLVNMARPLGNARYVTMSTFSSKDISPSIASGLRQSWYPWPYTEALTIEEASNELAFLATGIYGKPLPQQNGSPLRLVVPWKYGFKSIKSIVKFDFVERRPKSFWEQLQANEYGFWANINPQVPHPRWSQAQERMLGTGETRPTMLFNGYGEYVAGLYRNLQNERLYT